MVPTLSGIDSYMQTMRGKHRCGLKVFTGFGRLSARAVGLKRCQDRFASTGCVQARASLSGFLPALGQTANEIASLASASSNGGNADHSLYDLSQQFNSIVESQLQAFAAGLSPLTYAAVLAAGLLTSLSPCTLSVLPLTIGYIGGYSDAGSGQQSNPLISRAAAFAFGLATTLALLGVGSSFLGKAYGQIGSGLPIAISLLAILMGLNLLEVIRLELPSLDVDVRKLSAPPVLQAYLAGLTFALVASPCSTPVLATLLAYVSTTKDPIVGGSLLLTYTTGYVTPLLVAATFTGALKRVMSLRQWSGWITPASGVCLLAGGTYGLLSRTLPA